MNKVLKKEKIIQVCRLCFLISPSPIPCPLSFPLLLPLPLHPSIHPSLIYSSRHGWWQWKTTDSPMIGIVNCFPDHKPVEKKSIHPSIPGHPSIYWFKPTLIYDATPIHSSYVHDICRIITFALVWYYFQGEQLTFIKNCKKNLLYEIYVRVETGYKMIGQYKTENRLWSIPTL